MITIHIKEEGETKSISLKGHANFAKCGSDIICAAVSTIFQLAILGLQTLAEQYPQNIKIINEIKGE